MKKMLVSLLVVLAMVFVGCSPQQKSEGGSPAASGAETSAPAPAEQSQPAGGGQ